MEYFQIETGTLEGVGDGTYITIGRHGYPVTTSADIEFFGVSGAFDGLRGSGTAPVGADVFDFTGTYELSR